MRRKLTCIYNFNATTRRKAVVSSDRLGKGQLVLGWLPAFSSLPLNYTKQLGEDAAGPERQTGAVFASRKTILNDKVAPTLMKLDSDEFLHEIGAKVCRLAAAAVVPSAHHLAKVCSQSQTKQILCLLTCCVWWPSLSKP